VAVVEVVGGYGDGGGEKHCGKKRKLHDEAEETATRVTMSTQKTSRRQAR
jgi:hypothetical protein